MATTTLSKWTEMGTDRAEQMAADTGRPVVFAADDHGGYARHLRAGETRAEAVRDFEAAGEPCVRSDVFGD